MAPILLYVFYARYTECYAGKKVNLTAAILARSFPGRPADDVAAQYYCYASRVYTTIITEPAATGAQTAILVRGNSKWNTGSILARRDGAWWSVDARSWLIHVSELQTLPTGTYTRERCFRNISLLMYPSLDVSLAIFSFTYHFYFWIVPTVEISTLLNPNNY